MVSNVAEYAKSWRDNKKSKIATILNAHNCKIVWNQSKALFLHRSHRSQTKKKSLKKLGNCCKFQKFAKWNQTSPNVTIRWETQKKIKFAKFANFRNLQSSIKRRQMWQFVKKYKKIQVCQICKFSKFAKWHQTSPNVIIR